MNLHVLITGSTGMVGKGVLLECLEDSSIKTVTVLNRSSIALKHPKLREIILKDFEIIDSVKDQLINIDACFHCMGVSSFGMSEDQFHKLTFNISANLADTVYKINPNLVFNYVSGTGTDSTEKGTTMWARIKGKTENYLLNKGFKDAYMFRPGMIIPEKGIKSKTALYNFSYILTRPFFGILKKNPNITTTSRMGKAMINTVKTGFPKKHLENSDINILAAK